MAFDLTGLGSVFDFGKAILDRTVQDPAQRDAAKLALAQAAAQGELDELKVQLSAIVTEAQSTDPWTSRARPSFLYVIYVMLLASIPMGFLSWASPNGAAQVVQGFKLWLAAIPTELYQLFGVGYLGYTAARQWGKAKGTDK